MVSSWAKRLYLSIIKLKIKGKLGIAFVGFSALPVIISGSLSWILVKDSLQKSAIQKLSHLSESVDIRLTDFTKAVESDLYFISATIQGRTGEDSKSNTYKDFTTILEPYFYNLMSTKPIYYRLTYLLDTIKEPVFSYQRNLQNLEELIPIESKYSWHYYKFLTQDLGPDQIKLNPVELIDYQSDQTIAAFSLVLPHISIDGYFDGIIVADVFAEDVFSIIETTLSAEDYYTAGLVDQNGHYLYHSDKKKDWNRLLAESSKYSILDEFQGDFAKQVIQNEPGMVISTDGEVVYHIPLNLGVAELHQNHFFYIKQPAKIIFIQLRRFGLIFGLSIIGFILIALILSKKATNQFLHPINLLQKGSDVIAQGNFSHRLEISTGDEIEELANKFNFMAESINARDNKLNEYSQTLEQKIQSRTIELQDEKEKLRIILDNVPSAFLLLDSNQTVITASSALSQLTDFTSDEAIGKKCVEIFGTENLCNPCRQDSFKKEFQRNEDGHTKILEIINIPVRLTNGESACLKILSDITERINLHDQILQSEKLASVGEMAAVIAHEIRNSLTSANMLLQLIIESDKLDQSSKESLNVILSSTNRIDEITTDLLAYAKPAPLNKSPERLNQIVEESIQLYKHHFDKQNIVIKFENNSKLPTINIDRKLVLEVFNNILLNATQAIEKNGVITISIQVNNVLGNIVDRLKQVNFFQEGSQLPDKVIIIGVRDEGPGISPNNFNKIFEPFYTTKANGTGLGLSLAKRVIESHGGSIFVKDSSSSGTEIGVILPIK
jgi:PAS domain S-box-containing protein